MTVPIPKLRTSALADRCRVAGELGARSVELWCDGDPERLPLREGIARRQDAPQAGR